MRQLKRILKSCGLGRRINRSDLQEVSRCIEMELRGSGSTIGYRQMTQRLSRVYSLCVDKDTVRNLLKILDPEGYDKLKPFGFCIHGGIDGHSRGIMWLVRIEAWWGTLRKGCIGWWIRLFKDTRDSGMSCDADVIQCEFLKFCVMQVLRDELYKFAEQWNLHRMRPSTNMESPSGRPDILYFLPEINGARNLITVDSLDHVEIAEQGCCNRPPEPGCTDEFCELASVIMQEKQY
ncbi:PREDICTED: uncharacterized protein LOC107333200 [Acropora digitifera]|uniref:uncharacterized protein LOC107333200 n=1 Tax=Acropora digitifera TaxID=70779 RepID=UPI00077A4031|nr:PREDICTED: uncharacterized protein LOC107333200 [Acropora digitifera]